MELTAEQKIEKVKNLRPIDDVFFEVLAANKAVCQEMLQTILEDPGLIVEDVIVQSSERNIYGRSVRLDALCILGDGKRVNIEVQRSDNDDHLKRARFNASAITVKDSQSGDDFSKIPDVWVVYISEFDFLGEGKTIYHIDKTIRETGTVIHDGAEEIFVNTVIDDGSDIADLMSCFTRKQVQSKRFPLLSAEVTKLKSTEGGVGAVCKIMQEYERIAREEGIQQGIAQGMQQGMQKGMQQGRQEGRQEGRREGRQEGILNTLIGLVQDGLLSAKDAAARLQISEAEVMALASASAN